MTGWAVNSIASAVKGSSPFLPTLSVFKLSKYFYVIFLIKSLYSSTVERDTVNIMISVQFTLRAFTLNITFKVSLQIKQNIFSLLNL